MRYMARRIEHQQDAHTAEQEKITRSVDRQIEIHVEMYEVEDRENHQTKKPIE